MQPLVSTAVSFSLNKKPQPITAGLILYKPILPALKGAVEYRLAHPAGSYALIPKSVEVIFRMNLMNREALPCKDLFGDQPLTKGVTFDQDCTLPLIKSCSKDLQTLQEGVIQLCQLLRQR